MSERCVICLQPLSENPEKVAARVWQDNLDGWAHPGCAPTGAPEEELLRQIFGEPGTRKQRARAQGRAMADELGHVVTIEHDGASRRAVCACGWASHWGGQTTATNLAEKHQRDVAISGRKAT